MNRDAKALQELRDRLSELATAANRFDVFVRASDGSLPAAEVQAASAAIAAAAEQVGLAMATLYRAGQVGEATQHGRPPRKKPSRPRVSPRWPLLVPDLNGGLDDE